jgi:hypothetical protein
MRFVILALAGALLTGCLQSFKVNPPWPQIADQGMLKPCETLKLANTQDVSMAELVDLVQQNYNLYHECKLNNDSWIKWYTTHWKKDK